MVGKLLQEPPDAVSTLVNGQHIFLQSLGKRSIRLKYIKIFETVHKSNNKIVSKEAPEYDYKFVQLHIQVPQCDTPGFFFIQLLNFCQLYEQRKANIFSRFHFLETDRREQKKYEMTTQTSVDNTINDLRYEIKFESCVKDKNNFFIQRSSAFFS